MKNSASFFWIVTFFLVSISIETTTAGQITIKLQPAPDNSSDGKVQIGLVGSGTVSIDWDDGTAKTTYELDGNLELDDFTYYGYIYTRNSSFVRTITITGENVTSLDCSELRLVELNVSGNSVLMLLWCSSSQLTSLDVSRNVALKELDCSQNRLTALDVSNNTALKSLDCSHNQLTTLDVSRNANLEILRCNHNRLTTLDVSHNKALTELRSSNNRLTSLNVSRNKELKILSYDNDSVKLVTK
jgi:Leucine-rich repeat (LRR) protein